MKTLTTIILIGLLAWIGFVIYDGIYYDAFVYVAPAIFGIIAIVMYWALIKAAGSYRKEIDFIGIRCAIASVIASVLSFFSFILVDEHLAYNYLEREYHKYSWLSSVLSGLLGLLVLFICYRTTTTLINNKKEAIKAQQARLLQRKKEEEAHLLQLKRTQQAFLDASQDLFQNPEQSRETLYSKYEFLDSGAPNQIAIETLKQLLNARDFEKARTLLEYHPIDEHNLLLVMEALERHEQTGILDLTPKTYQIILENNETAYEKLPCNWQKIHTYLAPLEDEFEQADILDTGNIYITDQRVFFVGKKGSETVYLKDVAYLDHKEEALQFFRDEGLSEIFAFPTAHHAVYAKLVIEHLLKGKV